VIPDIGARRTRLATGISPTVNDLTLDNAGPVGILLIGFKNRSLAATCLNNQLIYWASLVYAHTLDNFWHLASALQHK
jgi:hypothetical protein